MLLGVRFVCVVAAISSLVWLTYGLIPLAHSIVIVSKRRWSHSYFRHRARLGERPVQHVSGGLRDHSGLLLFDGSSSTADCKPIPAFSGSQSVLFFSMAHATTAILRARAMAAFFLRVFWPPWTRS